MIAFYSHPLYFQQAQKPHYVPVDLSQPAAAINTHDFAWTLRQRRSILAYWISYPAKPIEDLQLQISETLRSETEPVGVHAKTHSSMSGTLEPSSAFSRGKVLNFQGSAQSWLSDQQPLETSSLDSKNILYACLSKIGHPGL